MHASADVSISKRFPLLGIPGRVVFKFDMGKECVKKIIIVDGGIRTHDKKKHAHIVCRRRLFFIGG